MKIVKFAGYGIAVLAIVVCIAGATAYIVSNRALKKTFVVTPRPVTIPTDKAAIARGEHIARTRGCVDCHGADFAGAKVVEDGAMGTLYGSNLTPGKGSRTASFKDVDWVRAIRHGVGPDTVGLLFMPSEEYSRLSDDDLGSVIAFLKSLPAVDRERVPTKIGPITRMLLATGKMKIPATMIDHANLTPPTAEKAPTADYGRYLANGCVGCHGPNFSGGKIEIGPPNWPPARNLTPHETGNMAKWSEADFMRVIRESRRPDGTEVDPVMPRGFAGMDDTELKALYAFFKTLPPVATGAR